MTWHPVEMYGRGGVWGCGRSLSKMEDGGSKIAICAVAPRDPRSSILDPQVVSPTGKSSNPGGGGIGKVACLFPIACLLVGLLGGCDADVNAVLGTDRVFTLYGVITPQADVSVARTFSVGQADVTLQGSLINAYDRNNLFYLDVFTLRRVDQLPLIPSLGLSVDF